MLYYITIDRLEEKYVYILLLFKDLQVQQRKQKAIM